jgi:O-antigen ligase
MLERFAVILAAFGIVTEIVYVLVFGLFHDKFVFVDEGDAVNSLLRKHVGVYIIVVAAVFLVVLYATKEKEWKGTGLKIMYRLIVAALLAGIVFIIVAMVIVTNTPENAGSLANIRMLRFDYDWGTHRGLNWRCAVGGFNRMSPLRKIFGTGQGGFEAYIYSFSDYSDSLAEMYGNFKLMVAHNEYLNFLIENGIIGCITYIGFIVSSFVLLWKKAGESRICLVALLALSGYFACSIFFFQHVYATSFMYLFVAMALSEGYADKKNVA